MPDPINSGDSWGTIRGKINAVLGNPGLVAATVQTFADRPALLAYTGPGFGVGSIWTTRAEGLSYEEVASGGDLVVSGVNLRALPRNGALPAQAFTAAPASGLPYLYGPALVTSGTELYNWPADDYQRVIGQEYLAAFHARVTTAQAFRIRVWGDSRPAGSGQTGNFLWHLALREAARQRAYYRGVFENNAIGGSTIQAWTDTHVDTFLSGTNDPHLIVFCAGINDLDMAGATPTQVVQRLDAFLEKIRVTKGYALSTLSIAVVIPISAYNPARSRDPRFIEPLRDGFRRLARKWQVCVIDGYAVAADGRGQRGLGYAADIPAPDVIHQNNIGMIPILTLLIDAVLPDLRPYYGGGVSIDSGSQAPFTAAQLPGDYPRGISLFRATPGGGGANWPVDGMVNTINFVDDIQVQYNFGTLASNTEFWFRKGRANAWGSWVRLDAQATEANVAAGAGFVQPASEILRTVRRGDLVVADGYLSVSPAGTIASGTTVGTVAVGFRPQRTLWAVRLSVWDGSTWVTPMARINPDGTIVTMEAVSITATRVYLNGASWRGA